MEKEIWLPVKGYEGLYEISNYGKLKSLSIIRKNGKNGSYRKKETISKHYVDRKKYLMGGLSKDGKCVRRFIHRLVAESFIPNPNNYPLVLHLDDNPSNPFYKNLMWGTYKMNRDQMVERGRGIEGEGFYAVTLTNKQVMQIRHLHKMGGITQRKIAEMFSTGYKNVNKIIKNQRWKHIL